MRIVLALMFMLLVAGCIGNRPSNPAATQPVTMVDPELAEQQYWLSKPPTAEVRGRFEVLWEASERTARDYLFTIDRRDQRSGLMTTEPMISKQWWEFWRKDAGTFKDAEEATIANMRRTIFFQFKKEPDGGYSVAPRVLVEKESKVDAKYKQDIEGPSSYWYSVRRDQVLEKRIADSIRKRLDRVAKELASVR